MQHTTKRMKKITELTMLAGFSATELSRMDNALLEKTYQASIPLIRAKQGEIARVQARENKHAQRKREIMAKQQQSQQASLEWLIKWKPLPPICTVREVKMADSIISLRGVAEEMEAIRKREVELFRKTGDHSHAELANRAREARDVYDNAAEVAVS